MTLFHCADGTDRRGIVAALFLGLAGASYDVIVEGYALSAEVLQSLFLTEGVPESFTGITPDDLKRHSARVVLAPPEAMLITLQHLDDKYGGLESHTGQIGLTGSEIINVGSTTLE